MGDRGHTVHFAQPLVDGRVGGQRRDLAPGQLGQPHLALPGRLLAPDHGDLLLRLDRLELDLLDQLLGRRARARRFSGR